MVKLNRNLPDEYGLSLTVYCPTASETNPINTKDVLVWDNTAGWGVAKAGAGAAIELIAKHPVDDPFTPLGVHCFGFSRVETFPYTGEIALGAGVVYAGDGEVRAAAEGETATGRVVNVDAGLVDVLLP